MEKLVAIINIQLQRKIREVTEKTIPNKSELYQPTESNQDLSNEKVVSS